MVWSVDLVRVLYIRTRRYNCFLSRVAAKICEWNFIVMPRVVVVQEVEKGNSPRDFIVHFNYGLNMPRATKRRYNME